MYYQFPCIFLFLFEKFPLRDPDPEGKMNADPCGSGFTSLDSQTASSGYLRGSWQHGPGPQ